jgi:uncharacterized phage protein gp47/JayE
MAVNYGLSASGFVKKTFDNIKTDFETYMQTYFRSNYILRSDTPDGQILWIIAYALSIIWNLMEGVYYAFIPSTAEGDQLDNLGEITGAYRIASSSSYLTNGYATGVANTVIPSGSQIATSDTGYIFETTTDNTIGIDGTLSNIEVQCVDTGAISALAGTLTEILTPVTGWETFTNIGNATVGLELENDIDFRIRRDALLSATGNGSPDAIKANVLELDNVTNTLIFVNNLNDVDIDGRPAKSFELVVLGGDPDEIAEKIWEVAPAGIESYGTTTKTVIDSQNVTQTIKFSRPTEVPIFIEITIETDTSFPTDGEDQISDALLAYFADNAKIDIAEDVVRTKLFSVVYSIAGVTNVVTIKIGKTEGGVVESDISMASVEIATLIIDNINIITGSS